MTLIYLTLAWIAGVIFADQAEPNRILPLSLLALALVGLLIYRKEPSGRLICGMILLLGLGMLRFEAANPQADDQHLLQLNDQQGALTLEGVVVAEPLALDSGLQVLLDVNEAAGHVVHGRLLAQVPRYSEVKYGDRVQLFGFLRTPAQFDTFSYRDYLARQKVYSVMYNADVEVLTHDQGSRFTAALLNFKDHARKFITKTLPEPQASLLVGILLGDDSGLPQETELAFNRTGTSHIIAISGYNMAVISQTVMVLLNLFFKDKRKSVALTLLTLLLYTLFVGAGASVVRAALMSGLAIVGQTGRRKAYVPTSLAFAVLLMSLYDPFVLWDIGFQLSFAAVLGITLFVPPMERFLAERFSQAKPIIRVISEPLLVTLAAQITTLPLILYYIGNLSLISVPINLLVVPVQTPLLLLGGLGVLVGALIPPLGALILYADWIFLKWTVEVVTFFGDLKWANREVHVSKEAVVGFFVLMLLVMIYQASRPRWARRLVTYESTFAYGLVGLGVITAILLLNSGLDQPDGQLHVTFLDVGGENAVLIESPNGASILVDGGQFPSSLLKQVGDHLPARTHHLDALILTSPQEENLAALPEVLDRYQIGAVLTTGQPSSGEAYQALLGRIARENIPLKVVTSGYQLHTDDGLTLEVLSPVSVPLENAPYSESGLVLRVTYGKAVFLLTGGLQASGEAALLQNPHLLQATVLQIPDHGSAEGSDQDFLALVNPQVSVLQIAVDRDPSPSVISSLESARLFRTDQDGSLEIRTDGVGLWIVRD